MALAQDHGLLPLLVSRLRILDAELVPRDIETSLRERQRVQVIFTLGLTAELFRIIDRLAASGVEVLLTKGPALAARCYGDPGSRQYTDLDLIMRHNDVRRATESMIGLGYEPKISLAAIDAKKSPGEYVFTLRDTRLLVEFHTEQTFRYHPHPLQIERLFARKSFVSIDGRDVPALSLEDELVLICIHGAKHFWTRLLWIADVAALISRQEINWDRALSAAQEVAAERMLRLGLLLAMQLLGARLPDATVRLVRADAGARRMAARIVRRLPAAEETAFGLFGRAVFRMQMRGGLMRGAAYLLRLSVAPTEEDWARASKEKSSWIFDAATRPFRLARKYRRGERA
jgi:hypothetical protein